MAVKGKRDKGEQEMQKTIRNLIEENTKMIQALEYRKAQYDLIQRMAKALVK